MYLSACPNRDAKCSECGGINRISGKKGEDLFTYCHNKKYITLHNGVKLYVLDKLKSIPNLSHATLMFTREDRAQCDEVVRRFLNSAAPSGEFTRGIYFKTLI
jgi:hypothetical protein